MLKFREHITKKGTKFALAISSIARSIYTAVVSPKMQYAAPIWHRPEDYRNSPVISQIKSLTTIQCQAMRTITGCFRTTSTAALQHKTQLLPVELELRKQITRYVTRLQSLPADHPIKVRMQRAIRYCSMVNHK